MALQQLHYGITTAALWHYNSCTMALQQLRYGITTAGTMALQQLVLP
jgi:hypothetical protein